MEEKNNEIKEEVKSVEPVKNPYLEEAKLHAERLEKASAEAKLQADRLEQLKANQLLSGTAGGHIETMKTPEQARQDKIQSMADEISKAFR